MCATVGDPTGTLLYMAWFYRVAQARWVVGDDGVQCGER